MTFNSKTASETDGFLAKITSVSFLKWIDRNLLFFLSGFLFAFIPLYPKIPLVDVIPGYIVRIRLEDMLIGITILIYIIQVLRKKAQWKTPFTWLIIAYGIVGLLSIASGIFITKTIPLQPVHIAKSFFHFFRYLEYFSLFFIAFSAIKTRKHLMVIMGVFASTVILLSIYGYGQRYWYWPVYSTMNREYSKGVRLYLTKDARVQSTFAGHYDMTGYLVLALPMLLSLGFVSTRKQTKLFFFISFSIGLALLILGASRTSFLAFLISVGWVPLLFAGVKQGWKAKLWWGFTRSSVLYLMIIVLFMSFGESIYDKLLQVFEAYPQTIERYHRINHLRKTFSQNQYKKIEELFGLDTIQMPKAEIPENSISISELEKSIATPTEPPTPTKPRPKDVVHEPIITITESTTSAEGSESTIQKVVPPSYTPCALRYGLSLCIRFDTLWPQAIKGFQRNPLLGSGYATLTKSVVNQFTEADSTDNNFLRTLGETGILGFITFYGLIIIALFYAIQAIKGSNTLSKAIAIGFISGTVGLLINALFIDIFVASKVAYTYWSLTGFILAYLLRQRHVKTTTKKN